MNSVTYIIRDGVLTFCVPRTHRKGKFCRVLLERGRKTPISKFIQDESDDIGFYIGENQIPTMKGQPVIYSFLDREVSIRICAALEKLKEKRPITQFKIEIVETSEESNKKDAEIPV